LKVNRSSIKCSFPIHHRQIIRPIFDPRSHPLPLFGLQLLNNMDLNAHYSVGICVQRSKTNIGAGVNATLLDHANSRNIIGSIEKFAAFEISWDEKR
jgi:hypothetical protein